MSGKTFKTKYIKRQNIVLKERNMKKFAWVLLMLLSLGACSSEQEQSFKGKEYKLLQAQNDANITLGFAPSENRFFGKVVNNFFGSYELDGNKIKFGPAGSTMMMGPQGEMEAEQNFLQILPRIASWHFVDNNLVLVTDNGQELGFEEIGTVKQ